ncbi:hypothetical protein [Amycolatopsis sp. NPDC004079]|uniref:hypothetical protein n=1 Tax=Amycolatopsis sp. NPDC004079 TaxID=3154549 RepID=UPI0033B97960
MTLAETATLRALAEDPARPVPRTAGADQTVESFLEPDYARRLVAWAAMSGYDPNSALLVLGYRVGGGTWDASLCLPDDLRLPPITTTSAVFGRSPQLILGWHLQLTPPGREPVRLDLLDGGVVFCLGTERQREAAQDALAAQRIREAARLRREDGFGPLDDVERAARRRTAAAAEHDTADAEWRAAITAAMAQRRKAGPAARYTVPDIARAAGVSRERVYQIHDNRR